MASILNNASFLFNPAGSIISYEEDKVFSVLPNDGTVDGAVGGDSGGGTRVNQQGYIEVTPVNLLTYSEDFTVGAWYRNRDAFIICLGVSTERFKIGYSYDLTVSKLGNGVSGGSHEVSMGINLKCVFFIFVKLLDEDVISRCCLYIVRSRYTLVNVRNIVN
jgi:hypothetical protein